MNIKSQLNKYINFSEKWLTRIVLVWCSASLIIGLSTVNDLALVIAAPLMTIFMYFSGMAVLMAIIGVQRVNSANLKFIQYAIIFFWGFGIFGFINFLINGIFEPSKFENYTFFFIVASVFPLGASLGAAKEWKKIFPNE